MHSTGTTGGSTGPPRRPVQKLHSSKKEHTLPGIHAVCSAMSTPLQLSPSQGSLLRSPAGPLRTSVSVSELLDS